MTRSSFVPRLTLFYESRTNFIIPSFLLTSEVSSWPYALSLFILLMGSDDVIAYLWWAKQNEEDPWLVDDITIAIRTVALAAQGCKDPNVVACYEVLGCHPATLQQRIEDRRRATLGSLYDSWAKASRSGFTYTDWWSGRADSLPEKKPAAHEILLSPQNIGRTLANGGENDLAPEHKGEIAARERLEPEGSPNPRTGLADVRNGVTARRDGQSSFESVPLTRKKAA